MRPNIFPIVDSHCHLWDLTLNKHPWLKLSDTEEPLVACFNQFDAIKKSYLLQDYLQDSQGHAIEKIVHIQAGWDRADFLGETQWLNHLHQQHGLPHAIVAYANLLSPSIDQELAVLSTFPLVKGIRQILAWRKDPDYQVCDYDFLSDARWQANFALLARYGFSFDLQIYPEQADQAYELLARYPCIPVVIEHLLQPTEYTPAYLQFWQQQLKKLSTLAHVSIKLSGAFSFEHTLSPLAFKHMITTAIACFGPYRCMFGSNFPVEKRFIDFDTLLHMTLQAIEDFSSVEQQAMLYRTATHFYRM